MQWIVSPGLKLHIVVIYIRHWSLVDSFSWNVESTSKLDYEESNTAIDPNWPYSEHIYHDDTFYYG